jgi:hypothetical protein
MMEGQRVPDSLDEVWGVLSILDRVTLGGLPPFSVVFIGKNCWGNIPYG